MAKILAAGFLHESNSFVPGRTEYDAFDRSSGLGEIVRGDAIARKLPSNNCIAGFAAAASPKHRLIPLLYAEAEPGPPVSADAFRRIVDEIGAAVLKIAPDAVYLDLHGAMITELDDDGDALAIEHIRSIVGPRIPIVATLDLHANVTERLALAADALVAYRTYPHIDMFETGGRAALLLDALLDLAPARPQSAVRHSSFMLPINRQYTAALPMAAVMAALTELEHREAGNGLLSVSLTTGFQQADIATPLPAALAYATSVEVAERCAAKLIAILDSHQQSFDFDYIVPEVAAARAAAYAGPLSLVIADAQDNPGGGGSADTMFVARALHAARVQNAIIAMIHDPAAAAAVHAAGVGAFLDLELGGRSVPGDRPLHGSFEVRALASGVVHLVGSMMGGAQFDAGLVGLLRWNGIDFAVSSKRVQCLDQGFIRHLGVEPGHYRVVVVKDALHFREDFAPIIGKVIDVIAPGFEAMDFASLPYTKLAPGVRYWGNGPAHAG